MFITLIVRATIKSVPRLPKRSAAPGTSFLTQSRLLNVNDAFGMRKINGLLMALKDQALGSSQLAAEKSDKIFEIVRRRKIKKTRRRFIINVRCKYPID